MSKKPTNAELKAEIKDLKHRFDRLRDEKNEIKFERDMFKTRTKETEEKASNSDQSLSAVKSAVGTLMAVKCPDVFHQQFHPEAERAPPSELELILRHIGALCGGDINPIY
jgi:regulator of replication initiation timing